MEEQHQPRQDPPFHAAESPPATGRSLYNHTSHNHPDDNVSGRIQETRPRPRMTARLDTQQAVEVGVSRSGRQRRTPDDQGTPVVAWLHEEGGKKPPAPHATTKPPVVRRHEPDMDHDFGPLAAAPMPISKPEAGAVAAVRPTREGNEWRKPPPPPPPPPAVAKKPSKAPEETFYESLLRAQHALDGSSGSLDISTPMQRDLKSLREKDSHNPNNTMLQDMMEDDRKPAAKSSFVMRSESAHTSTMIKSGAEKSAPNEPLPERRPASTSSIPCLQQPPASSHPELAFSSASETSASVYRSMPSEVHDVDEVPAIDKLSVRGAGNHDVKGGLMERAHIQKTRYSPLVSSSTLPSASAPNIPCMPSPRLLGPTVPRSSTEDERLAFELALQIEEEEKARQEETMAKDAQFALQLSQHELDEELALELSKEARDEELALKLSKENEIESEALAVKLSIPSATPEQMEIFERIRLEQEKALEAGDSMPKAKERAMEQTPTMLSASGASGGSDFILSQQIAMEESQRNSTTVHVAFEGRQLQGDGARHTPDTTTPGWEIHPEDMRNFASTEDQHRYSQTPVVQAWQRSREPPARHHRSTNDPYRPPPLVVIGTPPQYVESSDHRRRRDNQPLYRDFGEYPNQPSDGRPRRSSPPGRDGQPTRGREHSPLPVGPSLGRDSVRDHIQGQRPVSDRRLTAERRDPLLAGRNHGETASQRFLHQQVRLDRSGREQTSHRRGLERDARIPTQVAIPVTGHTNRPHGDVAASMTSELTTFEELHTSRRSSQPAHTVQSTTNDFDHLKLLQNSTKHDRQDLPVQSGSDAPALYIPQQYYMANSPDSLPPRHPVPTSHRALTEEQLALIRIGQSETERAIAMGEAHVVQCRNCRGRLRSPISYALVCCPKCRVISPNEPIQPKRMGRRWRSPRR